MSTHSSLPGDPSVAFSGIVGTTQRAELLPQQDYLIDDRRFDSEGNWAFCRFNNDDIYAVRVGFQRGGFNITESEVVPDRSVLQLHLELMTREGAVLWLPTGMYKAEQVICNQNKMDIRLQQNKGDIFSITGWPRSQWHFQSSDGDVEIDLDFDVATTSILPDCILPECVFSMWESMGPARGWVRYKENRFPVEGKVFFDHTRVKNQKNPVVPRNMYIYTTMYFEDGSGIFGYHAADIAGNPVDYYCFGIFVDADGESHFLPQARLLDFETDNNNLPRFWKLQWAGSKLNMEIEVTVKPTRILRAWGSPEAPKTVDEFIILPLVLDGDITVTRGKQKTTAKGYGLAEYFNADLWQV